MRNGIAADKHFFKRQTAHLLFYVVMFLTVPCIVNRESLGTVSLLGIKGTVYFYLSLAIAFLHHFYVWFIWRSELCYKRISPMFGGRGFRVYAIGFAIIGIVRVLSVLLVGLADYGSVGIHWSITRILAPAIAVLVLYALYSVFRYFGYERAVGADHFSPEYREKPFVREGIYRYTSNAMYKYALLLLFLIGIWSSSGAALVLGACHYIATWVHYYCTEKPDMQIIYGTKR